jgi:hypothetical protein
MFRCSSYFRDAPPPHTRPPGGGYDRHGALLEQGSPSGRQRCRSPARRDSIWPPPLDPRGRQQSSWWRETAAIPAGIGQFCPGGPSHVESSLLNSGLPDFAGRYSGGDGVSCALSGLQVYSWKLGTYDVVDRDRDDDDDDDVDYDLDRGCWPRPRHDEQSLMAPCADAYSLHIPSPRHRGSQATSGGWGDRSISSALSSSVWADSSIATPAPDGLGYHETPSTYEVCNNRSLPVPGRRGAVPYISPSDYSLSPWCPGSAREVDEALLRKMGTINR